MRTHTIRSASVLAFALLLAGCDTAADSPVAIVDDAALAASRSADSCVNVAVETSGALGLWMHDGATVFGLVPGPVVLGGVAGLMGSFVHGETISGSKGQGAHHIVLSHVFTADDGLGSFLTQDKASCAPGDNNPATCIVNDHMTIVSGTGRYANARGMLQNHGLITFTSTAPPAGTLDLSVRGRVCGDGL
jgi:hypothetical protein